MDEDAEPPFDTTEPEDMSSEGDAWQVSRQTASARRRAGPTTHARRVLRSVPQRSVRLLGTLGAIVLALLAILSSNTALQSGARQLAIGWLPTPTPTLGPGDQVYYLLPNIPWGSVLLDGHALTHVPTPGDPHPLRLARGRHEFEWRAAPFAPIHCVVWVPTELRDGCWFTDPAQSVTLDPLPTPGGWILPVNESLATLPPDQHAMLVSAAQTALTTIAYQTPVMPGERYALTSPGTTEQPVVARQPLLATLSFHLLADFGIREPCSGSNVRIDPCRFPGQDCSEFCTVQLPTPPSAAWTVAAIAWLSWDYTTLQGTEIARGQGDPGLNFRLVLLRIQWANGNWQVTPRFGHLAGVPSADDAICAAARVWLARGPLAGLLPAGNTQTTLDYFSGPAPSDGCAVVVAPHSVTALGAASVSDAASVPVYLVRFGVLLAVNGAAHALWPAIPRADPDEAADALRLAGMGGTAAG